MTDTPADCQYCDRTPTQWLRTPHGRPYCPHCRAIAADYQGDYNVGRTKDSRGAGWSDA